MKKILLLTILAICASSTNLFAQDNTVEKKFKGESEASAVVISGNANSETYGAKTSNTWTLSSLDLVNVFGRYIQSSSGGTETNKYWEAGLRYERVFMADTLSGFIQHKAEHDPYNGVYIQRDSTDLGLKYFITKTDNLNWHAELGYRNQKVYTGPTNENISFARAYTEVGYKISTTAAAKFWFEYLPNLKNSDEYQYNTEASLSVTMTDILSLKTAVLLNHNEASLAPLKKDTTTFTTALVAKY